MRRSLVYIVVLAVLSVAATPAGAAFPGGDGKFAFYRSGDIWTMNPDGSGVTQITTAAGNDLFPVWSPDGSQIAFQSNRDGNYEIYVMNADGSGTARLTNNAASDQTPAWSPDGTKIAFVSNRDNPDYEIYAMNRDGTDQTRLTAANYPSSSEVSSVSPAWSPDGTTIAYVQRQRIGVAGPAEIWAMDADGSNKRSLDPHPYANPGTVEPSELFQDSEPNWSPDGSKIVFASNRDHSSTPGLYTMNGTGGGVKHVYSGTAETGHAAFFPVWSPEGNRIAFLGVVDPFGSSPTVRLSTINPDGTDPTPVMTNADAPDWQPILRGYARPKGAGTFHAPLVPAYEPCTSPNRAHAAPLAFSSCNPPTPMSAQLTVGTPDANARPAASVASLRMGVVPGNSGTPADEAEALLKTSITDVRLASDLSDYTGSVELRVPLRITDKSNTPHPGGPGPGTMQDYTLTWNVPCAATTDPNIGARCALDTTADTLLPGSALEGRRAIWQAEQIEVRDGAGDPFLRQGVFVP
jgi:dipeptidyl aminopeptidase/acylaminoacyl peptidase